MPSIFHDDFKELLDSCIRFYEDNMHRMSLEHVSEKRCKLSDFVERFHKDCGTLSPSIQKRIEDLRNGSGLVLMTAHQPNLFPYSGVFRKATLIFVLARELERLLKVPVINFFGIADQDFTDDRWVRTCQLPAVQRSDGLLSIDVKLPEKLMLNKVDKPPVALLTKRKSEIKRWLNDAIESVSRMGKTQGLSELSSAAALRENFESFWTIVEDCYERSKQYSDFNAFVMSKVVNDVWGCDTVFSRFSDCQQILVDEFEFLTANFEEYSRLLGEARAMPLDESIGGGVSERESLLAPFWYHCGCGSKVRLFLSENDGSLSGEGDCVGCGVHHELGFGAKSNPDISGVASRISARAISMALTFFSGLMPSCYIGGIAGIRYLKEAEHVAEGLNILFPPIAIWRPRDKYLGVGQIEALLELKRVCSHLDTRDPSSAKDLLKARMAEMYERLGELELSKRKVLQKLEEHPGDEGLREEIRRISMTRTRMKKVFNLSVINHELKLLENVSIVLDLMPSIIDYAVNIGLKETNDQWMRFLRENGDLSSDVHLESVPSRDEEILNLASFAPDACVYKT